MKKSFAYLPNLFFGDVGGSKQLFLPNGNDRCHTTEARLHISEILFLSVNVNNMQ